MLLVRAIDIIYKETMGLLDFKRFHHALRNSAHSGWVGCVPCRLWFE